MKSDSRNKVFPILMMVAGAALILGAIIWFVGATGASSQPAPTPTQVAVRIPFSGIQRISLADSKAAYDLEAAVFIDVRGEPYFSAGHIPGALSIHEDELEQRLGELDPSVWYITYCT